MRWDRPQLLLRLGIFAALAFVGGNVDEWVINESGRPYDSALKGGSWGEYRNACRPATGPHDEAFRYYQIGFRCCRDPRQP